LASGGQLYFEWHRGNRFWDDQPMQDLSAPDALEWFRSQR
jgi:hypothetical protein